MSIIKAFSVGEGDMFYIKHNSDNFTVIDCCYSIEDEVRKNKNFEEIRSLAAQKGITRFISTHPDDDHIRGLEDLNSRWSIPNFYCVKNEAVKNIVTDSFEEYCSLRDSSYAFYVYAGCSRKWMNESSEERGSAGINFCWPKIDNAEYKAALDKVKQGSGYNNISPIFTYSLQDGVRVMWMGDMEYEFREKVKDDIDWPQVDILFAPHHGRESGRVSSDILKKINPQIIVIGEAPSKYIDYYSGYNTIKQNSAGDITFVCEQNYVHIYIENYSYTYGIGSLKIIRKDGEYGKYLGSFETHSY